MSEGSIRRRGPRSWEIKWDEGRDPLTGKRKTRFATVRGTKREAQKALREKLDQRDNGASVDPNKLTVADWLGQWLDLAAHEVAPKTLERYREIVEAHLIPALGHIQLAKLAPIHIQDYYAKALKEGRKRPTKDGPRGLSPQTVRHHDRVLNVALKRARALRLIVRNPVEDVTAPKAQRPEIEHLEPDEARTLLQTARVTPLYAPVFVALGTGLRRGELLGLRWSDLDLDKATLTVAQSLEQTKVGIAFKAPKTKRSRRTIALSPSVVEVLRKHRVEQLEQRVALGLGRQEPGGLVFQKLDGGPLDPGLFTKAFQRLVKKAGVRPVTFHGLRHTHFTNLLREGVHPKIASERAGHASVAITLDIYSHAVPGLQEDAALRIDAALRDVLGT